MRVHFTKMHGAGNDFVLLDARADAIELNGDQIRLMADRRFGIGCDQLLVVTAAENADLGYRIFNADGSVAQQCGNGARCVAAYVWRDGGADGDPLTLASAAGPVEARRVDDGVAVRLGVPVLRPDDIPFHAETEQPAYTMDVDGTALSLGAVSMGNPHAVLFVDSAATADVAGLGAKVSRHERFPEGANVGFAEVESRDAIRLRVFERGVGETLACGSGACAAVVAGRTQGRLAERVRVRLPGGDLGIYWPGPGEPVTLSGPTSFVFEGTIEI